MIKKGTVVYYKLPNSTRTFVGVLLEDWHENYDISPPITTIIYYPSELTDLEAYRESHHKEKIPWIQEVEDDTNISINAKVLNHIINDVLTYKEKHKDKELTSELDRFTDLEI